jgi:hypothetical protein
MDMNYPTTKGERREKKRNKRRRMRVDGASVRVMHDQTIRRSKKAREKLKEYGNTERTEDTD